MDRLLKKKLFLKDDNINVIAITDSLNPLQKLISKTYIVNELSYKHSRLKTIVLFPINVIQIISKILRILFKYNINGVISTGPGLAIIPCLLFRFFGKKLIVFESWSKFHSPTITAKILYHFAGLFIIQHQSMKKVFPKAKYWGKL